MHTISYVWRPVLSITGTLYLVFQAVVAMLACARLGAIHSVVFGGFSAQELARRIEHAEVRFIKFSTIRILLTS